MTQPLGPQDAWAVAMPVEQEGVNPPAHPLLVGIGISEPDTAGHQWIVLKLSDNTVTTELRIPWQVAAQFGQGIAQALAQAAQMCAAKAGPRLIIPSGPIPPVNLNGKAHGHGSN